MSRSLSETRRSFLKRLAKTMAFVPPAMVTLEVDPAVGQGKGKGSTASQSGGKGQGVAAGQGGLTPTANTLQDPTGFQAGNRESELPWNPDVSGGSPPWSRPPPTQTGR